MLFRSTEAAKTAQDVSESRDEPDEIRTAPSVDGEIGSGLGAGGIEVSAPENRALTAVAVEASVMSNT